MKIWLSPTGGIIKGHVLDCEIGALTGKLKEYDQQLYVKWNPKKLQGWGCWEVRRRPEFKRVKERALYGGNTYTVLEYVENNFDNHVMDAPFLNYKILDELKRIDTWQESYKAKNFAHELEYKEGKAQEKLEEKALQEKEYMIKQHKSQIRDFMQYVRDGGNPAAIADAWGK